MTAFINGLTVACQIMVHHPSMIPPRYWILLEASGIVLFFPASVVYMFSIDRTLGFACGASIVLATGLLMHIKSLVEPQAKAAEARRKALVDGSGDPSSIPID